MSIFDKKIFLKKLTILKNYLFLDKKITIRAKKSAKIEMVFPGPEDVPLFEMNPKGNLI